MTDALARDAAALIQVPSVTGDERSALERLGELAVGLGLEADLCEHDLAALRAHPSAAARACSAATTAAGVAHPLLAELDLPYPLSVGRLHAGEWSSSVPDRATFQGRLGVRVGDSLDDAAAALRAALADLPVELRFNGARFASGETPADHPFARLVLAAFPGSRPVGVPYGADMRLFCERGIPCVMVGTRGIELAHAVDERVAVADLVRLSDGIRRVIEEFGSTLDG